MLLLYVAMNDITRAIAHRRSEIERLQTEIAELSSVEKMLDGSPSQARPAVRRSTRRRKPAAAAAVAASEAKPKRKRRQMSAEEKQAVSERMTAYWAERRKKAGK